MESRTRYGVDEYLQLEETVRPQELVYGRLRDAPSPGPPHQEAVLRFAVAWDRHVYERSLGRVIIAPMDCVLDETRHLVVQPDLLFIRADRLDIVTDRVWGAPDLVLEVLSPKPRIGTIEERVGWFAQYGVAECWIYDQFARDLRVLCFETGGLARQAVFGFRDRIVSPTFPAFGESLSSILNHY